MRSFRSIALAALVTTAIPACVLCPAAAFGQDVRVALDLPAQPLDLSLQAVALATGRSIGAPAAVLRGRQAPALEGRFTAEEAVARLIAGTTLRQKAVADGLIISLDETGSPSNLTSILPDDALVVTGSRIRGASIASPVIRLAREELLRSGQTSLTNVVRSLPQNFAGGINVGVGQNAGADNGDFGGASTFNLRGMGTDATLTLLNGRRLAYNGARQGVDVSTIPLGAVERIEILPDGASALYGSDAVAGVANIILRKDFDGLRLDAEGGVATQGDYSRQRYGATAGTVWQSGGLIASYEFARSTALLSNDRSFSRGRPGVTIYPPLERHAFVLSGHQALTESLTFSADLLFNRRTTRVLSPGNPEGDLSVSRYEQATVTRSYAVAPALTLALPGAWQATLSGVYGNDRLRTNTSIFVGEDNLGAFALCYCNSGRSVELAGDGPLFRLPGGDARAALGVGYRNNVLNALRGAGDPNNVHAEQNNYSAYGEINLPLVSPEVGIGGVHRLILSGALRYERYPDIESVVTPKFGLVYAPVADIDIKGSWGRAFRAPSLLQLYGQSQAALYTAQDLGGTGYPADATSLLVYGGNRALKPERARTWTASVDVHPRALAGARLQLSYFNTRYVDRVIDPVAFASRAIGDPLYADLVTLNPALATTLQTIASAAQFFNNIGTPFDPSKVVAIVDTRYINAGRQAIQGVDILGDYRMPLGSGEISATLNATYLHLDQQLTPTQAVTPRSGILFTPPHWRGRASVTWVRDETSLDATLSVTGGTNDTRAAQTVRVRGMTTLDLTARYRLEKAAGILGNVDLTLSLTNAFDARPARIASTSSFDSTYDSTNYLPLGRVLNFGISKTW